MWSLRQDRRTLVPCFSISHSPGPQSFRPVVSTSRCIGALPAFGRGTPSVSARRLRANELSAVQAIAAQTPGRGGFHGTQYHLEHTLAVSAALIEVWAAELVEEGFSIKPSEVAAIAADYPALAKEPTRRDLVWRYGIASEIMDPLRRTTEIGNWLRTVIGPRRFVA